MRKYEWKAKFENGEYIATWNGYSPYDIGCFTASDIVLGGEERYAKCHGWFSGIGDVVWWDKTELDKLPSQHQDNLLKILKRNKPQHFMSFYMDKSHRELLQRIYRGLRSKNDKVYLLSPDKRVMDFDFK